MRPRFLLWTYFFVVVVVVFILLNFIFAFKLF